jgi:outer membrane autotransporter protein
MNRLPLAPVANCPYPPSAQFSPRNLPPLRSRCVRRAALALAIVIALSSLPPVARAQLVVNDGNTVTVDGPRAETSVTVGSSGTGTLNVIDGGALVVDGLTQLGVGGSGLLFQSGGAVTLTNGPLELGGGGIYRLAGGVLQAGGTNGIVGTGTFEFSGGTLRVTTSPLTANAAASLATGTTSTIDTNSLDATWTGSFTGSGALNKAGAGTLTLTQPIGYSGLTTISGGTLALAGASQVMSGGVFVDAAGTFDISAVTGSIPPAFPAPTIVLPSLTGSGTVNAGTNTLALDLAGNESFSGTVNLGGEGWLPAHGLFMKAGAGTLTVDGATISGGQTFVLDGALAQTSGNTVIDALVLGISTDPAGQPTNGTLLMSGGSLTIDTSLTIGSFGSIGQVNQTGGDVRIFAGCGDVARCASLNIGNQGGTGTYDISGGSLVFDGPGFVILGRNEGANASTGTLNLGGTGQVTVNQGQIVVGNNLASANPGSGTINQTGGTFTVGSAANLFLGGSGNGTYNLAGGTLQIGGYLNLGGSYAFNLGGGTVQVIDSTLNTSVDATLLAGTTSTIDTNGFGANWSGLLSGGGNLTKSGAGTLTLTQPIGYGGLTTVSAGTLALTGPSQVLNGGVALDAAGTLDISAVTGSIPPAFPGPAIVLPSLTGTGTVNVGTTSLALNLATNEAFGGTVNLGGEGWLPAHGLFIKTGTGTLTVDGATFSGGQTLVMDGALAQGNGNTAIDALVLGLSTNPVTGLPSAGSLTVSGGSLAVDTSLQVGSFGATGQVTQTGGDVRVFAGCGDVARCASLNIGNQGGTGTYDISGGSLTFDGPGFFILGRNDVANASTGTLNLSGTGVVSVNQGTLVVGNNLASSNPGAGTINQTGGTLAIDNAVTMYLAGSGNGTYNLLGGTLQIGGTSLAHNYLNQSGAYAFNLGGGTVQVTGTALTTDVNATLLAGSASSIDTNGLGATWSGVLSGPGGLTKAGAGTLALLAVNTYAGPTAVNAGTLQLGVDGALPTGTALAVNTGGTLDMAGFDSTVGDLSGDGTIANGGGTLTAGTAANTTFGGVIGGPGAFIKQGGGTLVLAGDNTYAGGTTIAAGTLQLGAGGASGSVVGDIANNGTLAVNRSDTFAMDATISGTGGFAQQGAGTTVLSAANTYSGGTRIDAGTLSVASDGNLGAAAGPITFNGGALTNTAAFATSRPITLAAGGGTFDTRADLTVGSAMSGPGALTKSGDATLILTGDNTHAGGTSIQAGTLQLGDGGSTGSVTGNIANNGVLAIEHANTYTLSGVVSGSGALLQSGTGTTILSADNTYSGGTIISSGRLQLGDGGAMGSIVGPVVNEGTLTIDRSGTLMLGGTISGSGALEQVGPGTTILGSANTYTGPTRVDAGTLQAGAAGAFGATSQVTVAAGATLFLDGFSQTFANLDNAGTVQLADIGATPGTRVTVTHNYLGRDGAIALNTIVEGDDSATDRLVLDGPDANATGSTRLLITNVGGEGAITEGNGIEVVQAHSTTTPDAFALGAPVVAGPYEYTLQRGSFDASAPESWFLRSTIDCNAPGAPSPPCDPDDPDPGPPPPNYRREVSLYAALAPTALQYARTLLDTLHERSGELDQLRGRSDLADGSGLEGSWGRLIGVDGEREGRGGIYDEGPTYDYRFYALQRGIDLLRHERNGGHIDTAGVYFAIGQAKSDVQHFDGILAGDNYIEGYSLGGYWTHYWPNAAYLDGVVQATWLDARSNSTRPLPSLKSDGWGGAVSLEGGYPFAMGGSGWIIEPQAQLVYQAIDMGDGRGFNVRVSFDDVTSFAARLGARAARTWQRGDATEPRQISGWARLSAWHDFEGEPRTEFSTATRFVAFPSDIGGTWGELKMGLTAEVSRNLFIIASFGYQQSVDESDTHAWDGKLGIRANW